MIDGMKREELVRAALDARRNSYSPYSEYRVGAALLTSEGEIYTGCNIESASYPCGICAERTAFSKAISDGKRSFEAIAVAGSSEEYCTPCGLCRQFMYEFSPALDIICSDDKGNYIEHRLTDLLPLGFGADSMK